MIDSNVVSDYFSASLSFTGLRFMDTIIDAVPNLSVITQIELLCWKTDAATEDKVKNFIEDSIVFNISPDVIDECIKIRKSKRIKTPDAIIAATALAYRYTLVTSNENDFSNIKGLKIINPHKI